MNVQTKVRPAAIPPGDYPNYFAKWRRECDENRRLWGLLSRSLTLLEMECDRRERNGEDVGHIRAFIAEARQ